MPIQRNRILVIDDREDHGQLIAKHLWSKQIPVLFFKFDEDKLLEIQERTDQVKHHGVRAIFMDINLSGTGSAGHADYVMAEAAINTLLDENNGPWALITWSTFDGDHPRALFKHLQERLPVHLRPVSLKKLDKEHYVCEADEREPRELSPEETGDLEDKIIELLNHPPALKILRRWETSVYACTSEVVKTLTTPALVDPVDPTTIKDTMMGTILSLAQAEAGMTLNYDNIAESLYNVLGPLLVDRIVHTAPSPISVPEEDRVVAASDVSLKSKLNSMLHLDFSKSDVVVTGPGTVFNYPGYRNTPKTLPRLYLKDRYEFLEDNFLIKNKLTGISPEDKKDLPKKCGLVLVETTPPCDHAQKKAVWRNFVIGVMVPGRFRKYFYQTGSADLGKNTKLKPKGEFVYHSPRVWFSDATCEFFLNSKLTASIPDENVLLEKLGSASVRIREQLLRDIMSWLGHQSTRPGIVQLG